MTDDMKPGGFASALTAVIPPGAARALFDANETAPREPQRSLPSMDEPQVDTGTVEVMVRAHLIEPDARRPSEAVRLSSEFAQRTAATLRALARERDELRAEMDALADALLPFARAFHARVQNPKHAQVRRDWNERMPGEWPIELKVTMADGRRARAALPPGVLDREDGQPPVRATNYREAAAHLERRAPDEAALGHYVEAEGFVAAAAELRRVADRMEMPSDA